MLIVPFETNRLRIRPQERADAGFALCIWGDPIAGKYLSDPPLDRIEDLTGYLEMIRNLNDSGSCYYMIAENKADHQPIGTCCVVVKENGSCWDIGYCVHPMFWNKGFAREMVRGLIDFGEKNGVQTFLADVAAENTASCRVLLSLGFSGTESGTFRRSGTTKEYQKLTFLYDKPTFIKEMPIK